ncbi:hypothetical protein BDW69DRAFT_109945 [Aspergillus filifer]
MSEIKMSGPSASLPLAGGDPTTSKVTASGSSTIVNAAENVRVDRQEIEFAKQAQIAALDNRTKQVMTTTNNYQYNVNTRTSTWPDNLAASFLQNRSGIMAAGDPFVWSEPLQGFRMPSDCESQLEENDIRWKETLPSVMEVNAAVLAFQADILKSRPTRRKRSSQTQACWSLEKPEIRAKLKEARQYYKGGNLKQSEIGRIIRDITGAIEDFFVWLDWLPEEENRRSLGGVIKCLITAVADRHEINETVLESLATALALFSDAVDYLQLCRKRRLTAAMMDETVSIFSELATLSIMLLQTSAVVPVRQSTLPSLAKEISLSFV